MPKISESNSPYSPRQTCLIALLCGLIVLAGQVAVWHLNIQHFYFPVGDDLVLIAHSTRVFHASPISWFTKGFSGYFSPYPDLSLPYSNFLRPVDNAVYYANSLIFGRHWSYYLLANYMIVATVVGLVCWISLAVLELSLLSGLIITLATAASSAFTAQIVYRPSFAFDYLAALWVLLTLALLIRRRLGWAWIAVWLAVFTKEPGFFTAVAAAIVVFGLLAARSWKYRAVCSAAFLIPLGAMFALRRLDFAGLGGVYIATGLSPARIIRNILIGMTNWPFMLPGEQHIFDRTFHNIGSLALSVILWGLIAVALYRFLWSRVRRIVFERQELTVADFSDRSAIVVLFLVGSLALPVLFDLTPRFGAACLPLFFITLGWLARGQGERPNTSYLARLAIAILILITGFELAELRGIATPQTVAFEQQQWRLSRSFINTLSTLKSPVVFLIDDASGGFSSSDALSIFSGYTGEIVPVSNLAIQMCSIKPDVHIKKTGPRTFVVESNIPSSCGSNQLPGAYRLDRLSSNDLERDLPTMLAHYHAADRPTRKEEFVTQDLRLDIQVRVPRFNILMPDLDANVYIIAEDE
jgi:hypothetical protein